MVAVFAKNLVLSPLTYQKTVSPDALYPNERYLLLQHSCIGETSIRFQMRYQIVGPSCRVG